MQVIIDTFVKDLVAVSQQSMRVVERVTLMSAEVDSLVRAGAQLEEMAATTRIVALNAQVEANRTRAGQVFRVVADETKRLAREADQFSGEIRSAVDRCRARLDETQTIVSDLASHDMTVALGAQANLARTVKTIDAANSELLITLQALQEQVNAAMTALQFDDILTQLLASIDKRILLLEQVWLDSITPSLPAVETQHMLEAWERRRSELEARQAVQQTNVEVGTAELF
jgi:methyl-accepting chemotaxis protein